MKPIRKTVVIGETAYEGCSQNWIDATLNAAKSIYEEKNVTAIYAVERKGVIFLKKEEYTTNDEWKVAIAKYHQQGFKVCSVKAKIAK